MINWRAIGLTLCILVISVATIVAVYHFRESISIETYNWYALWVSVGGLAVAIVAAILIYGQLRQAAESLSTSSLMAVLALEDGIARSRSEYSDALVEAARVGAELEKLAKNERKPSESFLAILEKRIKEKVEQRLNANERLCACIVRGLVPENIYRQDYRGGLQDVMDAYSDLLGTNTRFPNIVKVHDAWRSERSAVDPHFKKRR